MARSYVREARRGLGRRRERIVPIIERLAAEHEDAEIALRFRSDLELLESEISITARADEKSERLDDRGQRTREEIERAKSHIDVVIVLVELIDLFGVSMCAKACSQGAEIGFLLRYLKPRITAVRGCQIRQ